VRNAKAAEFNFKLVSFGVNGVCLRVKFLAEKACVDIPSAAKNYAV
jgi:hypothetical protein